MYADGRKNFDRELARFVAEYQSKYPKAVEALVDDKEALSAFFDLPADHWKHLRTTNPIESTFATVKLRTRVTRGAGSRAHATRASRRPLRRRKQQERTKEEIKSEETKKAGKIAA